MDNLWLARSTALIFRAAAGAASPAELDCAVVFAAFLALHTLDRPASFSHTSQSLLFAAYTKAIFLPFSPDFRPETHPAPADSRFRGCVSRARVASRSIRLFLTATTAQPAPGSRFRPARTQEKPESDAIAQPVSAETSQRIGYPMSSIANDYPAYHALIVLRLAAIFTVSSEVIKRANCSRSCQISD